MNRTAPLFVVGSLVVACSARVERLPDAGETIRADEFILEAGGKGFNVAVAAQRLGAEVDGLFAVGSDWLGRFARDAFAESGLSPELLVTMPGSTGAGIGFIEPGGENRIAVCPAANDRLGHAHVEAVRDRIAAASMVIAQFEAPDAPIAAAFAHARRAGVRTLLNPSPFRPIAPEIWAATDILVVNAGEAAALAVQLGLPSPTDKATETALADRMFRQGLAMLVVTRGGQGAAIHEPGQRRFQPAFQVEAVDSIGAGDAFIGGFATMLAARADIATALRWGCGAGALATARLGLLDALPDLAGLTDFLAEAAVVT